ncbi:hypothetical protein AAGW05_01075 [Arthrobacter sp. LAPM80]|uniref:hypothetical protein n=1 Tax=Arthrobacter sp. LAPM80 TaxID=3141788 RepID=UPI00398B68F9
MRPDTTLDGLFDLVSEQAIVSAALIDMIVTERADPRAEAMAVRVTAVAATLLARTQESGTFGQHVEADDVMLSISMLAFLMARTPPQERTGTVARARAILDRSFAPPPSDGR